MNWHWKKDDICYNQKIFYRVREKIKDKNTNKGKNRRDYLTKIKEECKNIKINRLYCGSNSKTKDRAIDVMEKHWYTNMMHQNMIDEYSYL